MILGTSSSLKLFRKQASRTTSRYAVVADERAVLAVQVDAAAPVAALVALQACRRSC